MPKTSEDFIGKKQLWRSVREKCLECCGGGEREVAFCTCPSCPLYALRFGRSPRPGDYTYAPGDERFTASEMAKKESEEAGSSPEGRCSTVS